MKKTTFGVRRKKGKGMKTFYGQFIDKKQKSLGILSVFMLIPHQTFNPFKSHHFHV